MPNTDANLILSDASHELCAASGDITLLTGPVGSGKSLWLERLAGLAPLPDSCRCTLAGAPWPDKRSSAGVRLLPDLHPPLFLGQRVAEELAFGLSAMPSDEALRQALDTWELAAVETGRDVRRLNRLEATRLALAAMELAAPKLVLLDNPVASLPVDEAERLCGDIRAWAGRAKAVVVVACNRWQDWQAWAAQTWHLDGHAGLPTAEATGV